MKLRNKGLQALICVLLCCVMLMGMAPAIAFADDVDESTEQKTEQSEEPSPDDPDIQDPDGTLDDEKPEGEDPDDVDPDADKNDDPNGEEGEDNNDDNEGEDGDIFEDVGVYEGGENADETPVVNDVTPTGPVWEVPEYVPEENGDDGIMTIADGTFHKMTDLTELVNGNHYIIVSRVGGNCYALTTDADVDYSQQIQYSSLQSAVSLSNHYVLELNGSTNGSLKFYGNDKFRLILGTSSSDLALRFDTSGGTNVALTALDDGTWWIASNSGGRYLQFNSKFYVERYNNSGTPSTESAKFEIWTDATSTGEEPESPESKRAVADNGDYYQVTELDHLGDLSGMAFVLVAIGQEDGTRRVIGNGNPLYWAEVEQKNNQDGKGNYVEVANADRDAIVQFSKDGMKTDKTTGVSYYEFKYLELTNNYRFYPAYLTSSKNSYAPFRSGDFSGATRFVSAGNPGEFYVRGNNDNYWLCYGGDRGYTIGSTDDSRVRVEVYALATADAVHVRYMDVSGNELTSYYVNDSITLIREMPQEEYNGKPYTFVGWSAEKSLYEGEGKAFLSPANSVNLYGYNQDLKRNYFLDHAINDLKLLGSGDPENAYTLKLTNDIPGYKDKDIVLYPVYAMKSFDGVVTAAEDGKDIVGVSDWKVDQDGDHSYQDTDREKWLGAIYIDIYKDGEPWVTGTSLYFSYHNDNTADLNIKFVWDDLVDKYGGVYNFVSLHNKYGKDDFPQHDQVGHFIIDGVIASQGGSEDGLYCNLNWMSPQGGQLDNVEGGSTVKIYVSTIYDVKYYLDDELIAGWSDPGPYTTPGTKNAFTTAGANARYKVSKDSYPELMERIDTDQRFDDGDYIARGVFQTFTYWMADPVHSFTAKQSPEELVAEGRTLTSTEWTLKNGDLTAPVAWSARYDIKGTKYTTENTVYAFRDPDVVAKPEAEAPYTYHLYAYTEAPEGTAPPTGDSNDLLLWTALLTVSLGGLTGLGLLGRKKRQK